MTLLTAADEQKFRELLATQKQDQVIETLVKRVLDTEDRITKMEEDRTRAFVWGIIMLGSAVIGLVTYIFTTSVRR